MWIFLGTIALVATLGYFKDLRPSWNTTKPATVVQVVSDGQVVDKINIKNATLDVKFVDGLNQTFKDGKLKKDDKAISTLSINENNATTTLSAVDGKVTVAKANAEVKEFTNAKIVVADKVPSTKTLSMVDTIQIFMLLAGAIILIFTNTNASNIAKNEIFRSGMIALVAVFGISWMAETMFGVHTPMIKELLGGVVTEYPWTYALMLLLVSKFVNSQAAALVAFVPLALGIGVSPAIILAFAPACYGYYILPTYPSDLAAIQFDRSGTTKIGKYVINHSFIIPGLTGVITSCIFGYILASLYGYL